MTNVKYQMTNVKQKISLSLTGVGDFLFPVFLYPLEMPLFPSPSLSCCLPAVLFSFFAVYLRFSLFICIFCIFLYFSIFFYVFICIYQKLLVILHRLSERTDMTYCISRLRFIGCPRMQEVQKIHQHKSSNVHSVYGRDLSVYGHFLQPWDR